MAAKFIGRRLAVGIGKEITRGTEVVPSYWLGVTSFSFFDKAIKARSIASTGGIWGGDQALVAREYAEGEMEIEMDDKSFGLIMLATLGTVSSVQVGATTAYKHTYTLQNDSSHDSLSIHTADPIGDNAFKMSMVDNISMEFSPEELVKYTVGFKSKSSILSSSTASYVANNKFLGRQLSVKIADAVAGLDAATSLTLSMASINIAKNTELYNVVGTVQPSDINNKTFAITGELEISFDDMTYRDYMLDGSYKALRFDLVSDVAIGTGSNPSFRIDLPRVDFDAWDVDYSLDDIVKQTITFTALYDMTTSKIINDCYIINEAVSY